MDDTGCSHEKQRTNSAFRSVVYCDVELNGIAISISFEYMARRKVAVQTRWTLYEI